MNVFSCAVLYTRAVKRRTFFKTLLSSFFAIPFVASGFGWASAHRFGITRIKYKLSKLEQPLKLVQLSDLHFGSFMLEPEVRAWVNASNLERPDLIVITGDLVHRLQSSDRHAALAAELGRLSAPLGVWAVLGNHDFWGKSPIQTQQDLIAQIEKVGIGFLNNAGVQLRNDFFLAGVNDLWEGKPDINLALEQQPQPPTATLLLSHNPDFMMNIPAVVDFVLSGHTHGGQIRIPGLPTMYNVSKYGERFQQGFVQGNVPGFVSRGLGCGGIPLRLFAPAELVVLELSPSA
jgi:uncharacterized protein